MRGRGLGRRAVEGAIEREVGGAIERVGRRDVEGMGRRWRSGLGAGMGAMLVACLCAACSGGGRSASATASDFVAAWNGGDGAALTALVDRPPAGLASSLAALTAGLHATSVRRVVGQVAVHGSTAAAPVSSTYTLPDVGPWKVSTVLALKHGSGGWKVEWSPAIVAPGLAAGQSVAFDAVWASRAEIVGAGGTPLTVQQPTVVVGVEGSRVKDAAALTKLLVDSGAPAGSVTAALAAASAHPTFFEPVFTLTQARFEQLGGNRGALYQAPGTVFQRKDQRGAVTPGLAAHLVGTVGPVTADELKRLGAPYTAASSVGQGGLESYYEKQLAGTPGGKVVVVGRDGAAVSTLASFDPVAGKQVSTSIDPVVQRAAEQALSTVSGTAALVAVRVSTGQVLASVSLPSTSAFDPAFNGEFPPGSTFKVLTSTALFQSGLTSSSPATCPPTATIDGETFHNAEGDRPVSTLAQAFTESCNTAFVQLASSHLKASDFTTVASLYGLGTALQMGYPAFAGKVPSPADGAALAATAIGQGSVVAAPLNMAAIAADVARGSVLPTRLVAGAPADEAVAHPLPAAVVSQLHTMMASVVQSGTAAGTGLPAGTYAKTGTAEYGQGNPLPTDAWLVGWHGDVAFAMVVQNSKGDGGPVDGPVVARFLGALPASFG